jgi:hypothetical protein
MSIDPGAFNTGLIGSTGTTLPWRGVEVPAGAEIAKVNGGRANRGAVSPRRAQLALLPSEVVVVGAGRTQGAGRRAVVGGVGTRAVAPQVERASSLGFSVWV